MKRLVALVMSFCFMFQQTGYAQMAGQIDLAGAMGLSQAVGPDRFRPMHLRYVSYDVLSNDLQLMLDKGDAKSPQPKAIEDSTQQLLRYFLTGVALPEDAFWVNLRPDSSAEMIDPLLEKTEMGKVMLEVDLQLKKDLARFTSPQTKEGKAYWDKLYKKAGELSGNSNIDIPTLTRPWIVPDEIIVREGKGSAYVYKATMKVMLEQDYLKDSSAYSFKDERSRQLNEYSSQIIRENIIPKLNFEINSTRRYAELRQVFYSLILAHWFKNNYRGSAGQYSSLIDSKDLTGLTLRTPWDKNTCYTAYKKSFEQGEYNIKEQTLSGGNQVERSYFSGGVVFRGMKDMYNLGRIGFVSAGKNVIDDLDYLTSRLNDILLKYPNPSPYSTTKFLGAVRERIRPSAPATAQPAVPAEQGAVVSGPDGGAAQGPNFTSLYGTESYGSRINRYVTAENAAMEDRGLSDLQILLPPGDRVVLTTQMGNLKLNRMVSEFNDRELAQGINNILKANRQGLAVGQTIIDAVEKVQERLGSRQLAGLSLNDLKAAGIQVKSSDGGQGTKTINFSEAAKNLLAENRVAAIFWKSPAQGFVRVETTWQDSGSKKLSRPMINESQVAFYLDKKIKEVRLPIDMGNIRNGDAKFEIVASGEIALVIYAETSDHPDIAGVFKTVSDAVSAQNARPAGSQAAAIPGMLKQEKAIFDLIKQQAVNLPGKAEYPLDIARFAAMLELVFKINAGSAKIPANYKVSHSQRRTTISFPVQAGTRAVVVTMAATKDTAGRFTGMEFNGEGLKVNIALQGKATFVTSSYLLPEEQRNISGVLRATSKPLTTGIFETRRGLEGTVERDGEPLGELYLFEPQSSVDYRVFLTRGTRGYTLIVIPMSPELFVLPMREIALGDKAEYAFKVLDHLKAHQFQAMGILRGDENMVAENIRNKIPPDGGDPTKKTEQPKKAADQGFGGIDFRQLPITVQQATSILNEITSMRGAGIVNLDGEMQGIQRLLKLNMCPSTQRIKEFLGACYRQGEFEARSGEVLACLAQILREQEEQGKATEPELKSILVLLEIKG